MEATVLTSEDRSSIHNCTFVLSLRQSLEGLGNPSLSLNNRWVKSSVLWMKGERKAVRGLHLSCRSDRHVVDRVTELVLLPEVGVAGEADMNRGARNVSELPMELDREPGGSLLGESYLWQAIQHATDHTRPPKSDPKLKGKVPIREDWLHSFEGNPRSL